MSDLKQILLDGALCIAAVAVVVMLAGFIVELL
jgi:hypothetical protein